MRKTIKVEELKQLANDFFENSPDKCVKERYTIQVFVADILHKTGNYKGFNILYWSYYGCQQWIKDGKLEDKKPYYGDESRIIFF